MDGWCGSYGDGDNDQRTRLCRQKRSIIYFFQAYESLLWELSISIQMKQNAIPGGFFKYIFSHKIVIINVGNIWWVPVIYLEQAHIYDAYKLQYMNWAMSTLLDAAIVLGAGPPVICVRHRVCHTLCHSVCHIVPPCATVCQPPGASTIIWQTRANIQTPPSVNPVVTNPLLLGTSPIL